MKFSNVTLSNPLYKILGLAAIMSVVIFISFQLQRAPLFSSDVASYWADSQALPQLDEFHVPGFPIIIRIISLALPFVSPVALMQAITLVAWFLSIVCVYYILTTLELPFAALGSILFGLYPLSGATEVVFPLADALARLCIVAAVLGYLRKQDWLLVAGLASGVFIHKALWPIIGLIIIVGLIQRRIVWQTVLLIFAPVAIYLIMGAIQYHTPLWVIQSDLSHEIQSKSALPIFDGLIGSFMNFTAAKIVKGLLCLSVFVVASVLMVVFVRQKTWTTQPILFALIAPTLLLGVILNQYEIFAMYRFAIFLVIPLWYFIFHARKIQIPTWGYIAIIVVLALTQIAWAVYTAKFLADLIT